MLGYLPKLVPSDLVFGIFWALVSALALAGFADFLRRAPLRRSRFAIFAGLLLATGSAAFFTGLSDRSIWADEDQQAFFISRCGRLAVPDPVCLAGGAADAQHPPGAYYFENLSLRAFGMTPFAARLPSVLAGLLGALFLFSLLVAASGRYLLSLAGAAQLFAHPYLYYYAREARPHIFAAAFGVLVVLATYDYLSSGRRRSLAWLMSAILMFLLSCGLQPPIFLFCWCVTMLLFGAWIFPGAFRRIPWFLAAAAAGIAVLAPYAVWGFVTAKHYGWTKSADLTSLLGRPVVHDTEFIVTRFLGPHGWVVVMAAAAGVLACAWRILRREESLPREAKLFLCFLFFSAFYYLFERTLFLGLFEHFFFPRYAIAVIPCAAAALVFACSVIEGGLGRAGTPVAFVLAVAVTAASLASPRDEASVDVARIDWKSLYEVVRRTSTSRDQLVYFDLGFVRPDIAPYSQAFYYDRAEDWNHVVVRGYWEPHPPLAEQLRDAIQGPGTAILAFDVTDNEPARAFFDALPGKELQPTFAIVRFPPAPDRDSRIRTMLRKLAGALGSTPPAQRLLAVTNAPRS